MTFQLLWKYPLDIVITVIPIVDLFVSEDFRSSGNWLGKSRFFLSRNMKNYSIPIFASFVQNSAMSKIQERRKENQAKGSILKIRNLPWSLRRVFFYYCNYFPTFIISILLLVVISQFYFMLARSSKKRVKLKIVRSNLPVHSCARLFFNSRFDFLFPVFPCTS